MYSYNEYRPAGVIGRAGDSNFHVSGYRSMRVYFPTNVLSAALILSCQPGPPA